MLMSNAYKLTYSGLVFAISSSENIAQRFHLLNMLSHFGCMSVTPDQLSGLLDCDATTVHQLLSDWLANSYVQKLEAGQSAEQNKNNSSEDFHSLLETLSVNGKVILANPHGLKIASSGYSESDSEYIAAIASNLVAISEQAKARIKNPVDKHLWNTGLSWGAFRALCMNIFTGSNQYVLVVGGLPNLEGDEFMNLISLLVRRYGCG